jgi:hypothetical protein
VKEALPAWGAGKGAFTDQRPRVSDGVPR